MSDCAAENIGVHIDHEGVPNESEEYGPSDECGDGANQSYDRTAMYEMREAQPATG